MRSKLFVPGSRPELFQKAIAGPADAISIDLEDAVLESRKSEARLSVSAFLREREALYHGAQTPKQLIVRVNAMATAHFSEDLSAVAWHALFAVNLPKIESADELRLAEQMLARFEQERGISRPIGILPNIESPRGLLHAAAIAAASPRVIGLQVGFGDLFEPLGIDRANPEALHQVQLAVRFAAACADRPAYDGAYTDVANLAGFRAEAEHARRLGYAGKSCIHPSQVPAANAAFQPGEQEVAFARRMLIAWEDAQARGLGAIVVEGRMVDKPNVERAQAIVAAANLIVEEERRP
jgi:citrate lyase subunit beta/citryl-CoA lyase